ncbi:MAG: Cna B-type domain-containing protein [Clostridiales bacterium]|nr:Cna B-type domain-containing protein [Clostridiales bacterium]
MKYSFRKMIAFLLTLVMVFNVMPVATYADPDPNNNTSSEVPQTLNENADETNNTPTGRSVPQFTVNITVNEGVDTSKLHVVFAQQHPISDWGNALKYMFYSVKYSDNTTGCSVNQGQELVFPYQSYTDNLDINSDFTVYLVNSNTPKEDANQILNNNGNGNLTAIGTYNSAGSVSVTVTGYTGNNNTEVQYETGAAQASYPLAINNFPANGNNTSNLCVVATTADNHYYAIIGTDGTIGSLFDDSGEVVSTTPELPAQAVNTESVKIVQYKNDSNATYLAGRDPAGTMVIDNKSYRISGASLDPSTHTYSFDLYEPCSVAALVDSEADQTLSEGFYYVVFKDKGTVCAYQRITYTDGSSFPLTDIGAVYPDDATFCIIKTTQEVTDRDQLQGETVETSGGVLDGIRFTWDSEPTNGVITVRAKLNTDDVIVNIIKEEGSPDLSLTSGYYYLVVGWNDGDDSYAFKELNNSLAGETFSCDTQALIQANFPHTGYNDLIVLLKRYDSQESNPRGNDGSEHVVVMIPTIGGVGTYTNTLTLDGDQYTFTLSGPAENTDGKQEYTITVSRYVLPKHTVTLAAEDGVDTTYFCAVLKWNINGQDYYAFAEFANGTPQYFTTLENQGGTTAYDPSIPVAEAFIIPGTADNHNYRNMTGWGNDWRKYNNQDINGKTVKIDTTSNLTTVITIGDTTPPTYSASLSFTEGGTAATPDSLDPGYYLVAKDADGNIYYAPVTADGIGTFVYPAGCELDDNKIPEAGELKFVRYTGDSASADTLKDLEKLTALGEYDITYPETPTEGVYQFTANKPVPCTAAISFVDADDHPDETPALDAGYTYSVVAYNNGIEAGSASFTGTGDLTFPEGTVINDTTTFKIRRVKDETTEEIASGGKFGLYTFTWGDAVYNVYTITAKKDRIYTAELSFSPDENITLGDDPYYVLVKGENNQYKYFAQVTDQGFDEFKDATGAAVTGMNGITGFEFVNAKGVTVNGINDLTGLAKIGDGGTIGEYYTLGFPAEPTESNVYEFTATKQGNIYYMQYNDAANSSIEGITLADGDHYYLLAKIGDTAAYYAALPTTTTATGETPTAIKFTDASGQTVTSLPNVTIELKKPTEEATNLGTVSAAATETQIIASNGAKYVLTCHPHSRSTPNEYDITATEISEENSVVIDFVDNGNPDANASLNGKYYVLVEYGYWDQSLNQSQNGKGFARINVTGSSTTISSFENLSGDSLLTIPEGCPNISIKIIKYSGEGELTKEYYNQYKDYDPSGNLTTAAGNSGDSIELYKFTWTGNKDATDKCYHITATKRVGYQASLCFVDSAMQNPVTPGTDDAPVITGKAWAVTEIFEGTGEGKNLIGFAVQRISTDSSTNNVIFDKVQLVRRNGDSYENSGNPITYEELKASYPNSNIEKVWIGRGDNEPTNYSSAQGLDYSDFEGYTFVSNVQNEEHTKSTVTMRVSEPTDYYVKLDCGETPLTIPEGYSIYAKVIVTHTSSTGLGFVKLDTTTDGGLTYSGKVDKWYKQNGTEEDPNEQLTGHENNVTVELYAFPSGTSITKPADLTGQAMKIGDMVQTHEIISYPDIYKDKTNANDNTNTHREVVTETGVKSTITDTVFLEKNDDEFNLYSIEKLLNGGYNVITLCDGPYKSMPQDVVAGAWNGTVGQGDAFIGCHQMGSVLIRGDVTFASKVTGLADSPMADNPSVIGGYIGNTQAYNCFINNRTNNTDDVPFYAGSSNTILGNTVNGHTYNQQLGGVDHGFNYPGATIVSDDYVDWDRLQRTVRNASAALKGASQRTINAANGETVTIYPGENVTINCQPGDIITVNIDAGENGFVQGVGNNGESIMIPNPNLPGTVINFNNAGNVNMTVPMLTVNDQTLDTTETGQGISVVYNYPNCTGTVNGPGTSEFGHIIAPKALLKVEGGNYSGTMIGNNVFIGPNAEGHLYPYKGGELVGFYGEIDAGKQVKDSEDATVTHDPTARQKYKFNLKQLRNELLNSEYEELCQELGTTDENIIFWENLQSPSNEGSIVKFEDIAFTRRGTYYFLISEDQTGRKDNETRDNTKYLIECTVKLEAVGNKSILSIDPDAPLKYYKVTDEDNLISVTVLSSDGDNPQAYGKQATINYNAVEEQTGTLVWHEDTGNFETDITYINTVETTETGLELTGTKTFEGGTLNGNDFTFTVTGPNPGTDTVATGTNNKSGKITFKPKLQYSSDLFKNLPEGQDEIIYTYTVKEDIPEGTTTDPTTGKPTKNGIIYDNSEKTIKVKVTIDETTDEVSSELIEEESDDIEFINERQTANVQVTKAFSGVDNLPDNFQIVATYTVEGEEQSKLLTLGTDSEIEHTGTGTTTDPYTWTITGLPVDTVVTFVESNILVDGYALKVNGTATTVNNATVTATVTGTGVASGDLVNAYTQLGDVQVTKAFSGVDNLPDNFQIVATYTVEGEEQSKLLTLGTNSEIEHTGTGTATDPYTWTITGLPVDTVVTFVESNILVDGYALKVNGTATTVNNATVTATVTATEGITASASLVNTYINNHTSAAVKKVWDDDNNREGRRPEKLTVYLLADGERVDSVTLSDANNWIAQINNLTKCKADGTDIVYSWEESSVEGYSLAGTAKSGILTTLTNYRLPEKTSVTVRKSWDDNNNSKKTQPDSIEVQLYADGVACEEKATLNATNGWKHTWTDLCKYSNVNGTSHKIVYTVSETEVPKGYVMKVTGDASTEFVITNTLKTGKMVIEKKCDILKEEDNPEDDELKTEIEIVKIWDDNGNKDGNRPNKITVRLYAGGKEVRQAELSEANGWRKTFGDLPKYVNGRPIKYSVTEDPVDMYAADIQGFTITNRYLLQTVDVSVQKIWDDAGLEKMRPKRVTVTLSNGMKAELNEKNGWHAVISDLPKYVNGQEAVYTWKESPVLGYEVKNQETIGNQTIITNKLYDRDETPRGGKGKKGGSTLVPLEDYETPLGVDVIINHVGDCFD